MYARRYYWHTVCMYAHRISIVFVKAIFPLSSRSFGVARNFILRVDRRRRGFFAIFTIFTISPAVETGCEVDIFIHGLFTTRSRVDSATSGLKANCVLCQVWKLLRSVYNGDDQLPNDNQISLRFPIHFGTLSKLNDTRKSGAKLHSAKTLPSSPIKIGIKWRSAMTSSQSIVGTYV